jgi:hypothetical protein
MNPSSYPRPPMLLKSWIELQWNNSYITPKLLALVSKQIQVPCDDIVIEHFAIFHYHGSVIE